MPNTNGHGPKRAILYARVSTDEQARSGYSLAQQIEALRAYAAREGYEVLEEVGDPGQSGASLDRPGMDRVRDLVAGGGVSAVLAQDRDRFAREPAYHYLLRREFEEYGTKVRALNDRGDDTPEGELTDGILDQLGKYERAKISERSRRGKLQKARQGKVMAGPRPPYGFRYNDARDNYVVDAEKMRLIERIFRRAGAEGYIMNPTRLDFNREGVQPPPAVGFGPRSTCARPLGASIREWFGSTKLPPHDQGMRHHARSGSPCPCRYLKPDTFDLYNIEYRCGDSQIHHQAAPSRAQAAGAAVIGGT